MMMHLNVVHYVQYSKVEERFGKEKTILKLVLT